VHTSLRVALGHLLMQDAAARGHPLDIARGHLACVPEAVAVLDRASQHIRDGLDAAMRMPGKTFQVICRIIVAKVIQQQKWIKILGLAEAEGALQFDPGAFDGGLRLNDLSHGS
jgi:hypothetical protein